VGRIRVALDRPAVGGPAEAYQVVELARPLVVLRGDRPGTEPVGVVQQRPGQDAGVGGVGQPQSRRLG
jgi:hypothetical protein